MTSKAFDAANYMFWTTISNSVAFIERCKSKKKKNGDESSLTKENMSENTKKRDSISHISSKNVCASKTYL